MKVNGVERAMTWMNSSVYGKPVVPRSGYIVELNALWYNALKFVAHLAEKRNDVETIARMEKKAEEVRRAFRR